MDEATTGTITTVDHAEAAATGEEGPEAAPAPNDPPLEPALALAREALIAAHPEAVPELIGGATVDELRASVEIARQAYARVAATVRSRLSASAVSPAAVTRTHALDPAALSSSAKIAFGLRQRDANG